MLGFQSQEELREFLTPVLKSRVRELKEVGVEITCNEMFDDLKRRRWIQKANLHLFEIVEDIQGYERRKEN